uniref:Uncharacterized protein n=1 Tax=Siphoviridae sp. ctVOP12 TaxID=2825531 RepID=A0A8S5V9W3_9CAUD|nr:MAG TPA: hypothetical protein [Siphoviridae sp. ctVOP12]
MEFLMSLFWRLALPDAIPPFRLSFSASSRLLFCTRFCSLATPPPRFYNIKRARYSPVWLFSELF